MQSGRFFDGALPTWGGRFRRTAALTRDDRPRGGVSDAGGRSQHLGAPGRRLRRHLLAPCTATGRRSARPPTPVVGRGKWFCHTFRDAGWLGVVLWVCGW